MTAEIIALPGADLSLDPSWLDAGSADALFLTLRDQVPWETHRLRLFGREVDAPRLSCWIGDSEATYTYSRVRFEPRPWPALLLPVRERLERELGQALNSVLANRYRDGRDSMGWHSDDEPELGPQPLIASLSLGATRRFVLRRRGDPSRKFELELPHGSLLTMRGETQSQWQHALPRTARPAGERINLTFRHVSAATSASAPRRRG